ncbi:MAG TPA: lysophospholipid acyltransferase family protein [Candidatus Methylomirabilis sp.]|nr:lysophospholipid acyltransferase family protein [Candidatus Methylomirabilis sp.]
MKRRAVSPREWKISLTVAPWVASGLVRAAFATLRRTDVGRHHPEGCWARGERIIVAFWHGRLLMMPFGYPGCPATILISQHRDGEYISRIARRLGFSVVRGSATRGGAQAFRQLVHTLREGQNVVITPDGPKGPSNQVKSGVIELSRLSGMPILPISFGAWPRTILKSWDQFLVPHLFGRGVFVWGEPIYVPPELGKPDGEKYQELLAERLNAVTAEADSRAANG